MMRGMTSYAKRSVALIAPYAAWMVMMAVLPPTAGAYAARGAVTAVLLAASAAVLRPPFPATGKALKGILAGVLAGFLVFLVWIAPETLLGLGGSVQTSSPYAPSVCGWPLTLAKLLCSAFVISAAEELFFRKWLLEFAGFPWMVALFAVEHGERWAVGAVAGVVYGLVARRFGLLSAIAAHALTNFVLGAWVIWRGAWQFW